MPTTQNIPKVSIIMNCYNCSKYLREAIDSVYAQTFTNWEIIFWDNASTDNSSNIAKSYDAKLRYFCSDKTTPLGNARNLAVQQARGEYIAFLDCDDLWLPEKLKYQVDLLDNKPELMLVFSNDYIVDHMGNILKSAFDNQKPERGNVFIELLLSRNFIQLLTVIIRKKVLDEVGLFNSNYKSAEEYDLFLKITYLHPIDYVDMPLAKYRLHEINLSRNLSIGIKEDLEIMDEWSKKYPEIKKEYFLRLLIKKMRLYRALYYYNIITHAHLPKRFIKFY